MTHSGLTRDVQSVLFGRDLTIDDISRWFNQGFDYCVYPAFGLRQRSGGPCGVLAAVQSEIIKYIYFEIFDQTIDDPITMPENDLLDVALCKAIQSILQRASESSTVCVTLAEVNQSFTSLDKFQCKLVEVSKGEECFEVLFNNLNHFKSIFGCISLAISLVCSRTIENIRHDMDTPSNCLIGQYGHSTQELLNLLLVGKATSNAIDGSEMLGDSGFVLKGIPERSSIGYLTHLEAFGHCRVGDYYKFPDFPIWIIGSSTHYSVLFSFDRTINSQSSSERLLSELRNVFNTADYDKCGFIQASKLDKILIDIGLSNIANNQQDYQRLQQAIKIEGDIIIWGTFWEVISKLKSGSSLDQVLQQKT